MDTRLGTTHLTKYVAIHESGRIINPQRRGIRSVVPSCRASVRRCTKTCCTTRPAANLTIGYYRARHLTHLDVPHIEVHFLEVDDGRDPRGENRRGVRHHSGPGCGRQRHLQCHRQTHDVTTHHPRQNLGMKALTNINAHSLADAVAAASAAVASGRAFASPAAGRICCSKSKTGPTRPTS